MLFEPVVSVIITTYMGNYKLVRAVESILNQTYRNIELIIVDDNGVGTAKQIETESVLEKYIESGRIKYIKHEKNLNGAVARNTGISNATGEYICFLDDDDIYHKSRIEKCINAVGIDPKKINAVYTGVIKIADGLLLEKFEPTIEGNFKESILESHASLGSGSNIFIKKDIIKLLNGFDTSFKRYQDIEFMVRASDYIYIYPIKETLIIKDNSNVRFMPNYEGLKNVQIHFFEKFEKDIMHEKNAQTIYLNKCSELLVYAYKFCSSTEILDAWDNFNRYIPNASVLLKMKNIVKGNILKCSHYKLYSAYQNIKKNRVNTKIYNSLSTTEKEFIKENS